MTMETVGEAKPVIRLTERAKPSLVTIGNHQIISSGCWNDGLLADYLMLHGTIKWVPIGELAKVAWNQNNIANKQRARRYISRLWNYLLVHRGQLLAVEYAATGRHQAQAVKIYNPKSPEDRQWIEMRLERMKHNKEFTSERYVGVLRCVRRSRCPGQRCGPKRSRSLSWSSI